MFTKPDYPTSRKMSLKAIAASHSMRCDAKQADVMFEEFEKFLEDRATYFLGEVLPEPFVKGIQPTYLEDNSGVPVINTLSIQNMTIQIDDCRYISEEDFDALDDSRKLKIGDVLLTVDGGTSIGKPVIFDLEGDFTIDSHVVILRPKGMSPQALAYLLASPLGQVQFLKSESGASGQTTVTEDDLRRFRFPKIDSETLEKLVDTVVAGREKIKRIVGKLKTKEAKIWDEFSSCLGRAEGLGTDKGQE